MPSRRDFLGLTATTLVLAGCGSSDSMNVAQAQTGPPPNATHPFAKLDTEGEESDLGGGKIRARVTGAESNNTFEHYTFTLNVGAQVAFHVHNTMDETITIVDGQAEFNIEGVKTLLLPGGTAFIPRGHNHGFRNAGTMPLKVVIFFSPSGRQDEFFRKLAALIATYRPNPPDPAAVARLQQEYDQVLVTPP